MKFHHTILTKLLEDRGQLQFQTNPETRLLLAVMTTLLAPFVNATSESVNMDEFLKIRGSFFETDFPSQIEGAVTGNAAILIAANFRVEVKQILSMVVRFDQVVEIFTAKVETDAGYFVFIYPAAELIVNTFRGVMKEDDLFDEKQFASDDLVSWFYTNAVKLNLNNKDIDPDFGGDDLAKKQALAYYHDSME